MLKFRIGDILNIHAKISETALIASLAKEQTLASISSIWSAEIPRRFFAHIFFTCGGFYCMMRVPYLASEARLGSLWSLRGPRIRRSRSRPSAWWSPCSSSTSSPTRDQGGNAHWESQSRCTLKQVTRELISQRTDLTLFISR